MIGELDLNRMTRGFDLMDWCSEKILIVKKSNIRSSDLNPDCLYYFNYNYVFFEDDKWWTFDILDYISNTKSNSSIDKFLFKLLKSGMSYKQAFGFLSL